MKAPTKPVKTVSWPAIQLPTDPAGSVKLYLTAIPAKKLFRVSYVSRADEDPQEGFQRTLNETRAKRIAEYLDEGNIIPGAVILSAKTEAGLKFDTKTSVLSYHELPKIFFVIDGQH